jgi:hypothetical protein
MTRETGLYLHASSSLNYLVACKTAEVLVVLQEVLQSRLVVHKIISDVLVARAHFEVRKFVEFCLDDLLSRS